MNIDQAVHEAAQASDAQLRKTYGIALARGATNTGCRPEEERLYGTLRLLTLATVRLPDLAMIAGGHDLRGHAHAAADVVDRRLVADQPEAGDERDGASTGAGTG